MAPTKRAQLMHAAAEKMKAAVPEIARLLSQEQGKPLPHAMGEIFGGAMALRGHASMRPE